MSISPQIIDDIVEHLQQCQFRPLCDKYFAEAFYWVIKGTSELSGEYHDKDDFFREVIGRLNSHLESNWKMHIHNTYATENALIIEMKGEVMAKSGKPYNNEYCWIFSFNADGKVDKLTAYYDSLLVNQTLAVKT